MALMIALGLMTGLQAEIRTQDPGRHRPRQRLPEPAATPLEDYRAVVRAAAQGAGRAGRGARRLRQGRCSRARRRLGGGHAQGHRARAGAHGHRARAAGRGRHASSARRRAGEGLPPILLGRDLAEHARRGRGRRGHRDLAPGPAVADGRAAARRRSSAWRAPCAAGSTSSTRPGPTSRWPRPSASSAQGDRATLVEVRLDDMYAVRDGGAGDPGARWATAT